eukprot:2784623-Rhodomonas_salina.3
MPGTQPTRTSNPRPIPRIPSIFPRTSEAITGRTATTKTYPERRSRAVRRSRSKDMKPTVA